MNGASTGICSPASLVRAAAAPASDHVIHISNDPSYPEWGVVNPVGDVTVAHGASLDIHFDAAEGYQIAGNPGVQLDTVSVITGGTSEVLHLTNITADHTVEVAWEPQ